MEAEGAALTLQKNGKRARLFVRCIIEACHGASQCRIHACPPPNLSYRVQPHIVVILVALSLTSSSSSEPSLYTDRVFVIFRRDATACISRDDGEGFRQNERRWRLGRVGPRCLLGQLQLQSLLECQPDRRLARYAVEVLNLSPMDPGILKANTSNKDQIIRVLERADATCDAVAQARRDDGSINRRVMFRALDEQLRDKRAFELPRNIDGFWPRIVRLFGSRWPYILSLKQPASARLKGAIEPISEAELLNASTCWSRPLAPSGKGADRKRKAPTRPIRQLRK
jgi:hypothetical protein